MTWLMYIVHLVIFINMVNSDICIMSINKCKINEVALILSHYFVQIFINLSFKFT